MVPPTAASSSRTVAALIAAQVAVGPARLAVVDGERTLTYAALDARANRLANHLRRHGAGRGRVVAVVLPQSAELVVATLAVLRSGAACAPADPTLALPRVGAMLADARPCAIVTRRGLATRLPRGPGRVVMLDADAAEIDREPTEPLTAEAGLSDLASLVYASASPVRARRVEVTHADLLDIVRWHEGALRVAPGDRALLLSSGGFAPAEIWPYLAAGASLHVPDDVTCMDPEALRDWVVAQDITIAVVATPIAERLLTLPWPIAKRLRALLSGAAVRHVASAGACFVGDWESLAEHVQVIQVSADHPLRAPYTEPIPRRGAIRVPSADTSRNAA